MLIDDGSITLSRGTATQTQPSEGLLQHAAKMSSENGKTKASGTDLQQEVKGSDADEDDL